MNTTIKIISRKLILCLVVLLFSCSEQSISINIPETRGFMYENHIDQPDMEVTVPNPLANELRALLSSSPSGANRGVALAMDTRRYLKVDDIDFQVTENEIYLLDDWGVRSWHFPQVQIRLDSLSKKQAEQGSAHQSTTRSESKPK